jgi:hypothetical protein
MNPEQQYYLNNNVNNDEKLINTNDEEDVINNKKIIEIIMKQLELVNGVLQMNDIIKQDEYNIIHEKLKIQKKNDNPTLGQAKKSEDWLQWKEAIEKEIATLKEMETGLRVGGIKRCSKRNTDYTY